MNWNKYLSTERMRESSITSEQRREHNDFRTDIESDFGRVIFSSACRRLHDKTQVFPLTTQYSLAFDTFDGSYEYWTVICLYVV